MGSAVQHDMLTTNIGRAVNSECIDEMIHGCKVPPHVAFVVTVLQREQDELKVGDQARPPPSAPHSALRPPPSTLTSQVLEVGGVSLGGSKLSEHVPAGRTRMTLTILRRCTCCSWKDGVRVPGGGAGSAQE